MIWTITDYRCPCGGENYESNRQTGELCRVRHSGNGEFKRSELGVRKVSETVGRVDSGWEHKTADQGKAISCVRLYKDFEKNGWEDQ